MTDYDIALAAACSNLPTKRESLIAKEKAQREERVARTRLKIFETLGSMPAVETICLNFVQRHEIRAILMEKSERKLLLPMSNLEIVMAYTGANPEAKLIGWGNWTTRPFIEDKAIMVPAGSIYYKQKIIANKSD